VRSEKCDWGITRRLGGTENRLRDGNKGCADAEYGVLLGECVLNVTPTAR
jgi:hypothetical protein